VASRAVTAPAAGLVALTLKLAPSFGSLAGRAGGLSAALSLLFTAPGRPALHDSVAVTFVRARSARPARRPARKARRARATRGHRA
jgi:hypothetical protein